MRNRILLVFLFFVLIILSINVSSFATFEIQDFIIDSELTSDGNLHVTETIVYYTDEVVNGLTRKILIKNPRNTTNSADTLYLNSVKVDGEYCRQVSSGIKGQDGIFEYISSENGGDIKLYSPFDTSYKSVEYDYVLYNVAVKYNDIGELFWNYIGDEWDCNINNLTINITLPELANQEKSYVFGHGSDNGTFVKNGNYITLRATGLEAYQPLDARILFSRDAINDSTKIINKNVLDKYINEEEGLSAEMETAPIFGKFTLKDLAIILSVIIIGAGIVSYIIFDKEIKVEKNKYFRELPFGLEPELLQYIYYGKIKSNSFYIAVLNLIKLGVYKLENTVNKVGKETQKIIYNKDHTDNLKEYQKDMIKSINRFLSKNKNGEQSADLISLASKMERTNSKGFTKYKSSLEAERESLLGKPAKIPQKIILIAIISMFCIIGIITMSALYLGVDKEMVFIIPIMMIFITAIYSIFFASTAGLLPVIIFLIFHCACFQGVIIAILVENGIGILYIPYILLFILIQYLLRIKKYSKEERQIVEKIAGLKRYIKDYSLLKDKDSLDYIELWEDYFIMSIALNLNKKVINYFYNYGKEQNSNLGYSIHATHSYMHFHHDMYTSFYNYQKSSVSRTSGGGNYSGSSGGFSGGSSSGGGGGRRRRRRTLLKIKL